MPAASATVGTPWGNCRTRWWRKRWRGDGVGLLLKRAPSSLPVTGVNKAINAAMQINRPPMIAAMTVAFAFESIGFFV